MLEQSNKAYSLLNVNPQTFLNKHDQTNQLSMQLKYSKRQQNSHIINPQTKFKLKAKDNKLKQKCKKLQEFSSYLLYSNNNIKQQALLNQYQHQQQLKNTHTLQHHHSGARITASKNHNQPSQYNENLQKKDHIQPSDSRAIQPASSIRRTQRKNYHKLGSNNHHNHNNIADPRLSQSQNKRQKKVAQSGIHTYGRNNNHPLQNDTHSHRNIFNNQIMKQHSYHSLDKSQREQVYNRIVGANSKIQSKLHLPQLNSGGGNNGIGGSNIKTINSKKTNQYSNMRQKQLNNQTIYQQYQQQHSLNQVENIGGISGNKRSKISPSQGNVNKSKVVKIPVDRLKQLKPQEIRLKFQRKIKQQQKNRAKQMAIDIFNRDQQENNSNSRLNLFDDLEQGGGSRVESLIRNW